MIPILHLEIEAERCQIEAFVQQLRLDPVELALSHGGRGAEAAAVREILADVAARGDEAIVDSARRFDDPNFTAQQIRVLPEEMREAAGRVSEEQISAIRRSIDQVQQYQTHILPQVPGTLHRRGLELGLRFTPLDSAGLYFPGGRASYPSSLIMLAVPAKVAGVARIIVCTPPSSYGRSDLVLAACHELQLTEVFRAGGSAAIAAMAFGTATIPAVDKIVGPGNMYVQLAKRAVSGGVGVDGFLGPSEIVIIADDSARPDFIAADLLAQAEHDPGSCFLLTDSERLAVAVAGELERQTRLLSRADAIEKAIKTASAIIVDASMDRLIELANRFAAEHVNLQTIDDEMVLAKLKHAGAVFVGAYSPVAAGDYVAGPSHCLPTNTTARFASGISVYEFLKRSSIVQYHPQGLAADANAIISLAHAEHLDAHAASIKIRGGRGPRVGGRKGNGEK